MNEDKENRFWDAVKAAAATCWEVLQRIGPTIGKVIVAIRSAYWLITEVYRVVRGFWP